MNVILKIVSWPFIVLIKLYQWILSPVIGPSCRFTPSCSNYALQAFKKYGPFKGFWLSVKRISRCHPWGGHGEDPVP
jgi:putative membrane protein insertion efficiency factor